jgi:hypothetical protein
VIALKADAVSEDQDDAIATHRTTMPADPRIAAGRFTIVPPRANRPLRSASAPYSRRCDRRFPRIGDSTLANTRWPIVSGSFKASPVGCPDRFEDVGLIFRAISATLRSDPRRQILSQRYCNSKNPEFKVKYFPLQLLGREKTSSIFRQPTFQTHRSGR